MKVTRISLAGSGVSAAISLDSLCKYNYFKNISIFNTLNDPIMHSGINVQGSYNSFEDIYIKYSAYGIWDSGQYNTFKNLKTSGIGTRIYGSIGSNIHLINCEKSFDENVGVVSGDGSTATFKLGTHSLEGDIVTDPSKIEIVCTPASPDAISASPLVCYLQDDDGDGVYESIYVKFASAPASGTDNVKVVWKVKYIG